ncbi:NFACT family protein [Longimicrobium sp.]|uniref:NFACT family protein n=1 Tax=Longimicrobium sp. TaxID=2029185 RepID=UPI002CF5AFAD|nr:NFACT family protein [Longimicrobium sp.]HSU14438.1 NFACT family protein [Longimicrobium sp.]
MSNLLRFDPPLARALAAELAALLNGRSAHPLPVFDSDLSATLLLDRGQALRWDLHPTRGWVRIVPRPEGMDARLPDARIVRVAAPDDERMLRIDLHEGNRFRGGTRALVVELHTNQWNALLVDSADRRIVSLLRTREAGGRTLRTGEVYHPPEPQKRFSGNGLSVDDARAEWISRLAPVPPPERRGELLRWFAGTSPINAAAILGDAGSTDDAAALETAFGRWWEMRHCPSPEPVLLEMKNGPQPYPLPLDGIPARRCESLLAAFELLAEAGESGAEERDRAELLERARRRLVSARRRIERLSAQRSTVGEAERLRTHADLVLANIARVQPGAAKVTVYDADGRKLKIAVDPALKPHEYAEKLYEDARRRSRAETRLPELLQRAEAEAARWASAVAAIEAGETPAWVAGALAKAEQRERAKPAEKKVRLPYRVYRTSGGLEVRVGKTSKDNDVLTFRHAHPEDVWLHARQVPGSHVVLRWSEEGAPPARDLDEAAVLAAFYSKARSSGTVAVDWTRRKYVRKPRGAPPGRVTLLQAKTVFVEPDAAMEERMREDESAGG